MTDIVKPRIDVIVRCLMKNGEDIKGAVACPFSIQTRPDRAQKGSERVLGILL